MITAWFLAHTAQSQYSNDLFVSLTLMDCKSMSFITNRLSDLWGILKILFQTVSLIFTATKLFYQVISERMKHKPLTPPWWWLTYIKLNLHCISCRIIHFKMCYMNQHKKQKQTQKSCVQDWKSSLTWQLSCVIYSWPVESGYVIANSSLHDSVRGQKN